LDSIETSFGSSFGCFESKLVSQDTLLRTIKKTARIRKNARTFRVWTLNTIPLSLELE
jgi:hypothetical protein